VKGTASEVQEGFVDANGLRLHWLRWQADGEARPPLLMLHATGFLGRLWEPVARQLTSDHTVYALDMRGHGDSDRPDGPGAYDWHNFVQDIAAALDRLGLHGMPIVGHSSGGATAAFLAATRPGLVSALVLIEPIIRPAGFDFGPEQPNELAERARRRRNVWPTREEMLETYRRRQTFATWREDALRLYVEHGTFQREDAQFELKCPGEIEAQVFDNSTSLDLWERLPEIACPTLILRGETTDPYLTMIAEAASKRLPGARLEVIPGAGHLSPMERPDAVAASVLEFLGAAPNGK
jgi:pimeloyl-ACP methyl ester carboxylesterase